MDSPKSSNLLRLITLNLWQRYGAWVERRSVLIDGIRALQPNLAAFAESIKTDEYDQVADLLGPGFNIVHSKSGDPNGMGIWIASRLSLGTLQEVDLNVTPRTAGFPCTTLVVEARHGFPRWGSHHPPPSPSAAVLSKEKPEDKKMSHEQGRHNCRREVERSSESPRLNLRMRPRVKRK